MNRTPTTAAVHNVTPEEKYSGKKPDLSHLKVFGCIAYVHILDELCSKLDPKAENVYLWAILLSRKVTGAITPLHVSCVLVEMWCLMRWKASTTM